MALENKSAGGRRWIAILVLAAVWPGFAAYATHQAPRPYMLPHDYDPLSFAALSSPDFWLYPIARNPGARLPRFGIDSVYYIGTQHGWAVSSDNVTIHTSNGGASWHAGDAGEEAHYYPAPWFWMESCVLLWLAGIAARRRN